MSIIKPTVGRKVWFRLNGQPSNLRELSPDQPMDATILHVWGDRCVNLLVNDHIGNTWCPQSVTLVQDGDFKPQGSSYAEWMPYQQGQAKKEAGGIQLCSSDPVPPHGVSHFSPDPIEREIVAKGLTAPRVTMADIEAAIAATHYFTAKQGVEGAGDEGELFKTINEPLGLLTFCVLVMRNGFTIVGKSACASPENFDAALGRKIARADAVNQCWPLLGYELRSKLAAGQAS